MSEKALEENEYEVQDILAEKKVGRNRLYLVKFKDYETPEWISVKRLSCPDVLKAYRKRKKAKQAEMIKERKAKKIQVDIKVEEREDMDYIVEGDHGENQVVKGKEEEEAEGDYVEDNIVEGLVLLWLHSCLLFIVIAIIFLRASCYAS